MGDLTRDVLVYLAKLAEQAELRLLDMEAKQAKAAEAIEQQAVEREAARRAQALADETEPFSVEI